MMIAEVAEQAQRDKEKGGESKEDNNESDSDDDDDDEDRDRDEDGEGEAEGEGWEKEDEEKPLCGFCGTNFAVVRCLECEDVFCGSCSNRIHSASRSAHTLLALNENVAKAKMEKEKRIEEEKREREEEEKRRWKIVRVWVNEEKIRRGASWRRYTASSAPPPLVQSLLSTLGEEVVREEIAAKVEDVVNIPFYLSPSLSLTSLCLALSGLDVLHLCDGAVAVCQAETAFLSLPSYLTDPYSKWACTVEERMEAARWRSPLAPLLGSANAHASPISAFATKVEREEDADRRRVIMRMLTMGAERVGAAERRSNRDDCLSSLFLRFGLYVLSGWEGKEGEKEMRAYAKAGLKERKADVELWLAYACVEAVAEERALILKGEEESKNEAGRMSVNPNRKSIRIVLGIAQNCKDASAVKAAAQAVHIYLRAFSANGSYFGRSPSSTSPLFFASIRADLRSSALAFATSLALRILTGAASEDEVEGGRRGVALLKAKKVVERVGERVKRHLSSLTVLDRSEMKAEDVMAEVELGHVYSLCCFLGSLLSSSSPTSSHTVSPLAYFESAVGDCLTLLRSISAEDRQARVRAGLLFGLRPSLLCLVFADSLSKVQPKLEEALVEVGQEDPLLFSISLTSYFARGVSPVVGVLPSRWEHMRRRPLLSTTPIVIVSAELAAIRRRKVEEEDAAAAQMDRTVAARLDGAAQRGLGGGAGRSLRAALTFGQPPPAAASSLPYRVLLPPLLASAKPSAAVRLLFRSVEASPSSTSLFLLPAGLESIVRAEEAERIISAITSKGGRRRTEMEEAELLAEDEES
uniref:B box-type domain-containing protein n=1 Tax=Palpitomonas bilix TaxID=652834 RepID=A0A7S3D9K6_9EUKA